MRATATREEVQLEFGLAILTTAGYVIAVLLTLLLLAALYYRFYLREVKFQSDVAPNQVIDEAMVIPDTNRELLESSESAREEPVNKVTLPSVSELDSAEHWEILLQTAIKITELHDKYYSESG